MALYTATNKATKTSYQVDEEGKIFLETFPGTKDKYIFTPVKEATVPKGVEKSTETATAKPDEKKDEAVVDESRKKKSS